MPDQRAKTGNQQFDLEAWAEARGIPESRQRPAQLAQLLGVTPDYIRKVLSGSRGPSRTIVLLADALDRLATAEADLARERKEKADAAIQHLAGKKDLFAMTRDELMAETRGDDG